jgi:hypothetical protein
METVALDIPIEVALSVTCPLSENVVGDRIVAVSDGEVVVGDGEEGDGEVLPQALVASSSTKTHIRFSIADRPANG